MSHHSYAISNDGKLSWQEGAQADISDWYGVIHWPGSCKSSGSYLAGAPFYPNSLPETPVESGQPRLPCESQFLTSAKTSLPYCPLPPVVIIAVIALSIPAFSSTCHRQLIQHPSAATSLPGKLLKTKCSHLLVCSSTASLVPWMGLVPHVSDAFVCPQGLGIAQCLARNHEKESPHPLALGSPQNHRASC